MWGVKLKHQMTHNVCSTVVLYYSRIQRRLSRSEMYLVPVILHIFPNLVNLQVDDQLNRADYVLEATILLEKDDVSDSNLT